MSKSRGNIVNPWEVHRTRTAPTPRAGTCTPPARPATAAASRVNLVGETVRKFLTTLWNTYSFFVTYANLSDFDAAAPDSRRWPSGRCWTAGCWPN